MFSCWLQVPTPPVVPLSNFVTLSPSRTQTAGLHSVRWTGSWGDILGPITPTLWLKTELKNWYWYSFLLVVVVVVVVYMFIFDTIWVCCVPLFTPTTHISSNVWKNYFNQSEGRVYCVKFRGIWPIKFVSRAEPFLPTNQAARTLPHSNPNLGC